MTVTAKGASCTVSVDGDWVTLNWKVKRGTQRLQRSNIISVDYKAANAILQGKMTLHTAAGAEEIVFRKGSNADFEAVRDAIQS
jgi:hypothetical protein